MYGIGALVRFNNLSDLRGKVLPLPPPIPHQETQPDEVFILNSDMCQVPAVCPARL